MNPITQLKLLATVCFMAALHACAPSGPAPQQGPLPNPNPGNEPSSEPAIEDAPDIADDAPIGPAVPTATPAPAPKYEPSPYTGEGEFVDWAKAEAAKLKASFNPLKLPELTCDDNFNWQDHVVFHNTVNEANKQIIVNGLDEYFTSALGQTLIKRKPKS